MEICLTRRERPTYREESSPRIILAALWGNASVGSLLGRHLVDECRGWRTSRFALVRVILNAVAAYIVQLSRRSGGEKQYKLTARFLLARHTQISVWGIVFKFHFHYFILYIPTYATHTDSQ